MNVLFLNGGGLDSLASLKLLSENEQEYGIASIRSVFVDFGLPFSASHAEAARSISEGMGIEFATISVNFGIDFDEYFAMCAELTTEGRPPRQIAYPAVSILALGMSYARMNLCDTVFTGQKNDNFSQVKIVHDLMTILQTRSIRSANLPLPPVSVRAALPEDWDVQQVVDYIGPDNPLISLTRSCTSEPACGSCPKCTARIDAGISIG